MFGYCLFSRRTVNKIRYVTCYRDQAFCCKPSRLQANQCVDSNGRYLNISFITLAFMTVVNGCDCGGHTLVESNAWYVEYCDRWSRSVVCLIVSLSRTCPCKNGCTDRGSICDGDLWGPKNIVLDVGQSSSPNREGREVGIMLPVVPYTAIPTNSPHSIRPSPHYCSHLLLILTCTCNHMVADVQYTMNKASRLFSGCCSRFSYRCTSFCLKCNGVNKTRAFFFSGHCKLSIISCCLWIRYSESISRPGQCRSGDQVIEGNFTQRPRVTAHETEERTRKHQAGVTAAHLRSSVDETWVAAGRGPRRQATQVAGVHVDRMVQLE